MSQPHFYMESKILAISNGLGADPEIFGVRDYYREGKYMHSRVSTSERPAWHNPHGQFKSPVIPMMLKSFLVIEVGDL